MQATATFGYEQIVTELIRGVLDTVADHPGLSPERRAIARQTVVCSVMAYNPRDPVETTMAGQCVVYDALMRDGAREMLRGQSDQIRLKARPGILSAGKMYLATMAMMIRMQGRAADQLAFARPAQVETARVQTEPAHAPDDADHDQPIAAQSLPDVGDAETPTGTVAPNSPAAHPGSRVSLASTVVGVSAVDMPASPVTRAAGAPMATVREREAEGWWPDALAASGHSTQVPIPDRETDGIPHNGPDPVQDRTAVSRVAQGAV